MSKLAAKSSQKHPEAGKNNENRKTMMSGKALFSFSKIISKLWKALLFCLSVRSGSSAAQKTLPIKHTLHPQ
jgi:hypothetical protein